MQHSPPEIKDRLLKALDSEYNVVDMGAVLEVITILEKTHMTKESLEVTRLGKHINEFRRKTNNEALAKRAKDLLRRWRSMIVPGGGGAAPVTSTPPLEPLATLNGSNSTNITGPGPGGTHKSCRSTLTSPAMSTASSSSPGLRRLPSVPSSPQLSRTASPRLEPVGRTHASNKRLRKENLEGAEAAAASGPTPGKQQRVNGCCTKESASISPLVPNLDLVKKSKHSSSSTSSSASTLQPPPPPASTSSLVADTDIVKAKMAQMGRRVKTTQELLQDLKHRDGGGSVVALTAPNTDADDFRRSKTEHLAKFLNSQAENERPVAPPKVVPEVILAPGSPTTRRVAEILSSLPPIDLSVLEEDQEEEEPPPERSPQPPPEALIEQVLAGDPIEGVTGTREEEEGEGDKTEQAFKEWHEPVWRRSYDAKPFLVWPYVITD
ncbi:mediator of RNA polymerase II transcription subunit 26 [Neocloeon triangulifer]|uniref:mediator of RNA polymerase II transcription subunit 26 n=1 Tax=Neocloeon triangulifer TaxID=2078957 RepID=UPI00286F0E30|nr:mediator of RNA polymerase II transcription subunit 26 [Neocloeon triangulifer]